MSERLGRALAAHLSATLNLGSHQRNFVIVEGVPSSVAEGMLEVWDHGRMPQLAVASRQPELFGASALAGEVSGTALRNSSESGVVLVLCDGEEVPDRQSLNLFQPVSPSDLLATSDGLYTLATQRPAVTQLDGPGRAVRKAIVEMTPATRPSAIAVADYFDRLAAGDDPLAALPHLGGYRDVAQFESVDSARITDNLALASRRTSEELTRAGSFALLRARAEQVLGRRPGHAADAREVAGRVMQQLTAGDPEILRTLCFDEARAIFEQRSDSLPDIVRHEMSVFQSSLIEGSQASQLPWDAYERRADQLGRSAERRAAAKELCDLDDAQLRRVFTKETRAKLEKLQRDRSVSGNNPSCPEAAIVRAAQQLGGTLIERVQVLSPALPAPGSAAATNRTGAGKILTIAAARLRLGGLMHYWADGGGDVDGLLLRATDSPDVGGRDGILAAFEDAGLASGAALPPLQLRLHAEDKTTVQVDWRPDLDDVALLKAVILFAETPVLAFGMDADPTLHEFCGGPDLNPLAVPRALAELASNLNELANQLLSHGLTERALIRWVAAWRSVAEELEQSRDASVAEDLALAGAIRNATSTALTPLAPMKAEWLAQYLAALWKLVTKAEEPKADPDPGDAVAAASAVARTTAAHHPAHIRLSTKDRPLLPSSEGRMWSLFGGRASTDESGFAQAALDNVIRQLLTLQPEAAGHFRCLAWGPGAADMLALEAIELRGRTVGKTAVNKIEVFCVGSEAASRPSPATLARLDDALRGERDVLQLRYIADLDSAKRLLRPSDGSPAVHLALVTGLTEGGGRLQIDSPEVDLPEIDEEVLFAPRVWQRPRQDRRTLLMPPAVTATGAAWLRLQNAVEDDWVDPGQPIRVPEIRTGTLDLSDDLASVHELALWVATLDRYATRDSLEQGLRGKVSILHQQQRLGGDSPLSLVVSQKSGGPVDRAVGRSLRAARIVDNPDVALSIGKSLREVASQGYGILALQAATSGSGINELVGHVVAFSLLATKATPWPLPPDCRVLLVSLDEYRHWFPGKRADLLAIAIDTVEVGVHVACIEVKARRGDGKNAASDARDQLNQTLAATRWAAQPVADSIHSRLWLNRIAEAAYAVARETRFRLDSDEIAALEAFRRGFGSLEWAGLGLVFGPDAAPLESIHHSLLGDDIVPVSIHAIPLTESLLRTATDTDLTKLRTADTGRAPLLEGRKRRRPETRPENHEVDEAVGAEAASESTERDEAENPQPPAPDEAQPQGLVEELQRTANEAEAAQADLSAGAATPPVFDPPALGWDAITQEAVRWHPTGPDQNLQNGHIEIWGSSGMGKTQFTMTLLAQLARRSQSRFGIADFKNDYSGETGFTGLAGAEFIDLWRDGASFNPLALEDDSPRAVSAAIIELRDTVDEATRAFTRMGHRQKQKLEDALREAYHIGRQEGRWPTLLTLNDLLDSDLAGLMGDLTRHDLFRSGPPLGDVIDSNVVFGLSKIPGNGQTTILAAGFILSALLLKVQNLPPVANTIRYVVVVDEAHRVSDFRAIQTMIREGRSKGLSVILATQQPIDLPDVVQANAQTKICFGLPDATVATMAARRLDPSNSRLPEQIRTLAVGEAFVSLGGRPPRLLRMAQAFRDYESLGLPAPSG